MASEKKLILVFIELIALIGINLGYEKPCNVSTSTIEIVQTCPTDEKSYKEAADRKNCAAIPNHCESFVYHCVRNKEKNALIEVCAPWLNIIGQVCGTYDEGFMSIKRREKESCMNFTNTCPWHYNSTEQFKYPGCYEVGKTEPQEKNKSSNGEIIAVVFVAVTCIILFILIMYISHVRNKKRKSKSYLRGNNPNIAEAQLMNQSNFSEPNIDNVTTAGNEMSRDQNEYLIPDSQVSINTADDNYIGQFIPTSLPSSVAQQVTSTDQDLSPETFSLTSSSTATEISPLTKDRDKATAGDVHLNALFTELDGRAGTFPYEDSGATSQLQDPDMITFGESVSDIIEGVKKVIDGAESRLDSSVQKICKQKLKEAEKTHQKELDMIRKQIEAENRKIRRQISEQQTQITGIARQLQESQSQTNEIKDKLKEKEQELVEMRKEISRLNDEIIKLER